MALLANNLVGMKDEKNKVLETLSTKSIKEYIYQIVGTHHFVLLLHP
jgi:hypothetical protein